MSESLRVTLLFICCVLSLLWLGLGLIAPLTPSEETPSAAEVTLFYFLPLLLSGSMYRLAKKLPGKIFSGTVFMAILIAGAWVLSISYRTAWPFTSQLRICKSLQAGITEADLVGKLGEPYTREDGNWFYFHSDPVAAGPIRAKIDSSRRVVVLRCYEDGAPTWSTEK
jgi:hypothetical protein